MNVSRNIRLAALCCAVSGLVATTALVQAQQDVSDDALRELGIMRNIFGAALQSNAQDERSRFRMGAPEALYLAGQGMVFTFQLNGSGGIYVGNLGDLSNIAIAPAPAPPASPGGDFDFDYDFDFDFDFDFGNDANFFRQGSEEQRAYQEQVRAYQEQMQAMNEEIRTLQQELRETQRGIRDMEREQRRYPGDIDHSEGIEKEEAYVQTLMEDLQAQTERMQQVQQEYQAERLQAFEEVRARQTDVIFEALCGYGNTLRSLSGGEHVNIVLRNYADDQTQVHVFDYADFADCSSAEALRQAATTYVQSNRGF